MIISSQYCKVIQIVIKFVIISSLILFQNVFSQPDENAGYTSELISGIKNPVKKIDTLNYFASELMKREPKKALIYCSQSLKLFENTNYPEGKKNTLYYLTLTYKQLSQLDSALIAIKEYLTLSQATNDSVSIAMGYLQMGNLLRRQGENDSAQKYLVQSNNIYNKLNDKRGLIGVLNSLGSLYKAISEYDSAAKYYLQVLQLSEEIQYDLGVGSALINLGNLHNEIGQDSIALVCYLKSITINMQLELPQKVALAYSNIGSIYTQNGNYDSAMYYYDQALVIQQKIGNIIDINNTYLNKSKVYSLKKEYKKALDKCNLAIEAYSDIKYLKGLSTALQFKAEIITELGLYQQASDLLDSSLAIARKIDDQNIQKNIAMASVNNFARAGQFEKAFEYQKLYNTINEDILSFQKQSFIAELTSKYEKEQDQAHILMLTNENLEKDLQLNKQINQRNIFLFTGAGFILLAIAILVFYRVKTRNDNYLALQKIRQLEKDKKLISVQFLMEGQEEERKRIAKELHDGIGVLLSTAKMQFTSIKGVAPSSIPKINNATKLLEMASSEVRKITHNMMPGLLSKYGFFEAVEELVDQINDAGAIKASLNIAGDVQRFSENKEFMLYRIVQEMINNSLKHAKASEIEINVELRGNKLKLQFHDDGIGFDADEMIKQKSIGLTSLNSRSNYLGGNLIIDTAPGKGTRYELTVSIS